MTLTFDESSHSYHLNGVKLPGVTSVLSVIGGYDGIPAKILEIAAARGQAVHRATELEDLGTLDYASLDDEVSGYLVGYQRFKDEMRPEFIGIEQPCYHKQLHYAGTADRELILHGKRNAKLACLDLKTCLQMMPTTGPQTAAYTEAINSHRPNKADHIRERYGLKLGRDGTFELVPYTSPSDWQEFLACLRVTRFRQQHQRFFKQLAES